VAHAAEDRGDARGADLGDGGYACTRAGGTCRRCEHAANGVEDHVRAVRGEFPDPVGNAFAIGDWFGTELVYVGVVLRGGGADDACSASSRDLDGEGAHPAGRPVHEQDLARLNG
jgi:hypothetical protein